MKLTEVCRIQNGYAFDSGMFSANEGMPLIRIRDLKTNRPSLRYNGKFDDSYVVRAGDLLIGMDGEFRCYEWKGDEALLNQRVCRLLPDEDKTDRAYLLHAIADPLLQIEKATPFTTVKHIASKQITSIDLPIPDLEIQKRIGKRLTAQMAAIEQARQQASTSLKTLRPLLEKMICDSFHGIIPLSLGIDEAPAPEGWRWHSLLDLARLATGHTPSRRCPEYWADGDIPWMALPDIRALDCLIATTTSEKTNAKGIANSSARVLPPGTVALSRTASVGFVTIFGREMATSQDFVNWVCGPDLHAPFLMWLLRGSRAFIKAASTGAVHQTVYMDVVERFRVCLPDLPTQQKIATRLNEAFHLIQQLQSAHEAQLEALDNLPGASLREAFGSLER